MSIFVHSLVKNEENFIWFAINSVINYVDKIFVWDTGSTDRTSEIIQSIKDPKIDFKEKGEIDPIGLVKLRQEMFSKSESDWIFILDGDEIWWEETLEELLNVLKNPKIDVVVTPTYMAIGDIYHYQESAAGLYKIGGRVGHFNIRAVRRNIPGLHVEGKYPDEAYVDKSGIKVQDFPHDRIYFMKNKYLHLSHLKRSSKSVGKIKNEIGISFPRDFYYPEVFFWRRPSLVASPWRTPSDSYKLRAQLTTPFKRLKRRIL